MSVEIALGPRRERTISSPNPPGQQHMIKDVMDPRTGHDDGIVLPVADGRRASIALPSSGVSIWRSIVPSVPRRKPSWTSLSLGMRGHSGWVSFARHMLEEQTTSPTLTCGPAARGSPVRSPTLSHDAMLGQPAR
ncbi:hypothetical protein [Sorangium sp. So ce341]|uniref:hypothetical protein n=1 Tax=Sorangium sp. So ce341 TaxID=3133302 RepID=UPI003F61E0F1